MPIILQKVVHYIAISSLPLPLPLHTFWKCYHYHYHYFRNVLITIVHFFRLLILQPILQQQNNDILYILIVIEKQFAGTGAIKR